MNPWRNESDADTTDYAKLATDSPKPADPAGKDDFASASSAGQASSRQTPSVGMQLVNNIPTIRSRVTVVCAECKKQKLKCDRRMPCESCTKRNTVSRCVYTPAAIEKVDVTSINNRLRVVEGSLNALGVPTQGYQQHPQSGLPWQAGPHLFMQQMQTQLGHIPAIGGPGYSLPNVYASPNAASSSTHNDARLAHAIYDPTLGLRTPRVLALANDSRSASVAAPLDGAAALWVRECSAELALNVPLATLQSDPWDSTQTTRSAVGNMVSSEKARLDLRPIDRESSRNMPIFGFGRKQKLPATRRLAMFAGLGIPSTPRTSRENRPKGVESQAFTRDVEEVPNTISAMYEGLATELIKQLPPRRARNIMLSRLGAAILAEGMGCIPFNVLSARIEAVCSFTSEKCEGLLSNPTRPAAPSFSSIAEAAVSLAFGALIWATEKPVRRATRVVESAGRSSLEAFPIDTGLEQMGAHNLTQPSSDPSHSQVSGGNSFNDCDAEPDRPDLTTAFALYRLAHLALSMHTARHGHAARDPALIHTYILSAHYLLMSHATSTDCQDALLPAELPGLVGTLVWEARAMGLGVDPDEFDPPDNDENHSEAKTVQGENGLFIFVKREDGTGYPEARSSINRMSMFMKEVRRRLWWEVVWLDLLVSDAYGYNATIQYGEYTTRCPSNVDDTRFNLDSTIIPPPDDSLPESNQTFGIAKIRLIEVVKRAPLRLFRSGPVPNPEDSGNSSISATQKIADDIVKWLNDLPERFKLEGTEEDIPPIESSPPPMTPLRPPTVVPPRPELDAARALLITQRCDLAFMAYHGIVRLFTPTACSSASTTLQQGSDFSWFGNKSPIPPERKFVALKAVAPALAIVHAAQVQMTCAPNAPFATYHMYIFPRRLFDAAVVLAYVAIQQPLYTSPVVTDAVRSAIDILARILKRNPGRNGRLTSQKTEAEAILEMLLDRAEKARQRSTPIAAGVKRKHDDLEAETNQFDGPFHLPFMSSGIINQYRTPSEERPERNVAITSEGTSTAEHRSSPVFVCSNASTLHDGPHSQVSTNTKSKSKQQRHVPVVGIRQRVKDRINAVHAPNVPHSGVTQAASDRHASSPTHSQAISDYRPQHPHSQYSSGPQPRFSGEMSSASPISPLSTYDAHDGARSTGGIAEHASGEAGFMLPVAHPVDSTPQQAPPSFPSSMYQYQMSGQSYSASPLQPTGYDPSMTAHSSIPDSDSNAHHHSNMSYSDSISSANAQGDGMSSSFNSHIQTPFSTMTSQSSGLYTQLDPSQQSQSQASTWHGSEGHDSGSVSQHWNTPSFMN